MKPTDEQIKALRKGDVVTVRAVVDEIADDGDVCFRVNKFGRVYTSPSEIMTIEPREIKVGDRVRHPEYFPDTGVVRHIENGWAAVSYDSGSLSAHRLKNLQVIP